MEQNHQDEKATTYKFFIAGVQHHKSNDCLSEMEVGNVLALTPEPTNGFDPNAVRIEFVSIKQETTIMLGYVPAKISASVTADITIQDMKCEITELNKDLKPWERIKVLISTLDIPAEETELTE